MALAPDWAGACSAVLSDLTTYKHGYECHTAECVEFLADREYIVPSGSSVSVLRRRLNVSCRT